VGFMDLDCLIGLLIPIMHDLYLYELKFAKFAEIFVLKF